MRIEAARQAVADLPITPSVLATLRETARLFSTHYSTMIEGNRLTQEQVSKVIENHMHFPGRERDETEVLGYYAALEKIERLAATSLPVSEAHLQALHDLVMGEGRKKTNLLDTAMDRMSSATVLVEASSTCRQKPKMFRS